MMRAITEDTEVGKNLSYLYKVFSNTKSVTTVGEKSGPVRSQEEGPNLCLGEFWKHHLIPSSCSATRKRSQTYPSQSYIIAGIK